MKNFFTDIKHSLSKSSVYTHPETNTVKKSLGVIAILVVILAFIQAVVLGLLFSPALHELRIVANESIDKFPAELVLTLKDGRLSMNRTAPYILPLDPKNVEKNDHKNFIVIDTSKTLDFKALESYDTAVLITQDGYMTSDTNGKIEAQSFKSFPDYVLSKDVLTPLQAKMDNIFGKFLWVVAIAFSLLMWVVISVGGFVGAMFWALIGILLVLLVSRIRMYKLSFSQLYALSLRAYVGVVLFSFANYLLQLPGWVGVFVFLVPLLFIEKKAEEVVVAEKI